MGILDVHAEELQQAGRDTAFIPPKTQPTAKFSAWSGLATASVGAVRGLAKGGAEGSAESIGFMAEIAGAFGQALAATGTDSAGGMFSLQSDTERKQSEAAAAKVREQGLDFSNEAGDLFRNVGRDYRPDPKTSSEAERIVHGFGRFASKAVGYSLAGGPVVGAGLTGADEALTAADDLRVQGVDLATRSKVGAVVGVTSAAGVALPVAGKTLAQTVGLVAAGGPLSFAGQQAATRYILDNAGYSQLASQYDPFDPVGLAVSTLVPAGFGAWGLRGARRRAAETKPAVGETKAPEAVTEPAPRETPEPLRVTDDHVAAARVSLAREIVDGWNLGRPEDARAAAAHLEAFARAQDQLATGQRVEVADLIPAERITVTRAIDQMVVGLQSAREDIVAAAANLAEPGAVRVMREELASLEAARPDTSEAAIREAAKQIQAADGVSYKKALSQAKKLIDEQATDFEARISRVQAAIDRNAEAQQAVQELQQLDRQIETLKQERQQLDAPSGADSTPAAAARQLVDDVARGIEDLTGLPARDVAPVLARDLGVEEAPAGTPNAALPAASGTEPAREPGASGTQADPAALDARIAQVEQQLPDLQVMLDGMDKPMPMREFLAKVKAEAAEEAADGPLYQVAANCFLLNGA